MGVYIKGMEIPKSCAFCRFYGAYCYAKGDEDAHSTAPCPLVPVPPHGRLIDADALIADLKRQCREVFRIDAVSPNDFWINRNEAYNQRLWQTWCEGFYDYLGSRQTIIEAEEGE